MSKSGLLVDLSANPDGTLHHSDQIAEVCRRENLADLVAADTPLGPEQAAARLRVRRADFDHMVRLGWIRSSQSIEVRFNTSRAGAATSSFTPRRPSTRCPPNTRGRLSPRSTLHRTTCRQLGHDLSDTP
ncbi:hypothetical protein [Streptomyces lavendofoliae]|uniref:hypothetical protein n=1 Tax=Streptomyces lavendofoliae TaxID=67314 RepID=UPI00300EBD3C